MLRRIDELIASRQEFAFETTLSTRSFVNLCHEAPAAGYSVNLIFFWLDSVDLALERVKQRVLEGGHNIPVDTIKRRYSSGLRNFVSLYQNEVDYWLLIDNSRTERDLIAEGKKLSKATIFNELKWIQINDYVRDQK
jgi:predicted ABC-type ATPase